MKILRRLAIILAVYVGLALSFDALVGFFQPGSDVLRVYDSAGKPYERVLSVIEDGDQLWVVSGHHFRGWYRQVLASPDVELIRSGVPKPYRAVALDDDETRAHVIGVMKARSAAAYYVSRALLLFAQVKPVRLDPR
jgi:hypothetical protein